MGKNAQRCKKEKFNLNNHFKSQSFVEIKMCCPFPIWFSLKKLMKKRKKNLVCLQSIGFVVPIHCFKGFIYTIPQWKFPKKFKYHKLLAYSLGRKSDGRFYVVSHDASTGVIRFGLPFLVFEIFVVFWNPYFGHFSKTMLFGSLKISLDTSQGTPDFIKNTFFR